MNEESLFAAALEKPTEAERRAFLEEVCAGDVALRRRVERLLAAEQTRGILERGADAYVPAYWPPEPPLTADRVFAGRFELRQKLGEGGMGAVWDADQIQPVRRRVALKVIRPGLDSARLLARFDQERQALALMDHPNIAKVLDAGIDREARRPGSGDAGPEPASPIPTPESGSPSPDPGRPYFVMELIEGVSITRYCDDAKLPPRERLELFIPVCHAVQHAHQKGVIHRDLKPSNILVGLYDGEPIPKVIDFGIAKATGPRLTEQTVYTEVGSFIGTLEYMSPEQAELNNLDIDTRSDIYSLGVVLYELLTGTTPLQRRRMKDASPWDLLRVIREDEPPTPSTRLGTTEELSSIAANRALEPNKLQGLVRGELDWIVMKCLEKDRARRYQTANDLAMDLQRYLADEPVEASSPSTAYRLKKFLRRHRGPVLATSIIVLLLVGGIIGTTAGLKLAADRLARVRAEKRRADEERAIAQVVDDFVQKDLLGQADIGNQVGRDRDPNITVRELLDRAAQGLEARFRGQERTEAAIRLTLGRAYRAVGEYAKAQEHMQRSLALRRAKLGPWHPDTLESMHHLAGLQADRGEYGAAERLYEQVLAARRAARGPDHPDTLLTLNNLGLVYSTHSQYDKAEPLLQGALEARRARLGPDHLDTLESLHNVAQLHWFRAQYERAEPLYKQALRGFQARLGPDHPNTLTAKSSLAALYSARDRYADAEPLLNQVLAAQRAKRGPDHPDTLDTLDKLAQLYQSRREFGRAEVLFKQVLAGRRTRLGAGHPDLLSSINNLAACYTMQDRFDEAEPLFKEVLAAQRAGQGAEDLDTIFTMHNLGVLYRDRGRYREAEPLLREAAAGAKKNLGPGHPTTRNAINNLAFLYGRQGTPHLAEPLLREVVASLRESPGAASLEYAGGLGTLSQNLLDQNKFAEAEPFARDSLSIRAKARPDGWTTFYTKALLGGALLGQGKFADAEPLLVQGYAGMKAREAKIPTVAKIYLIQALEQLVQLYASRGQADEAAKWRNVLAESKAAAGPPVGP